MALGLQRLARLDRRASSRIALPDQAQRLQPVHYWLTRTLSHLGDSWVWWGLAYWLWRRESAYGRAEPDRVLNGGQARILGWLSTLLVTAGLTLGVKQTIRRARPGTDTLLYGSGPDQYSFPSGHAARMGVLSMWAWLYGARAGWLVSMLALLVSWTRVRLGIHFVGDVAVGLLLGALIGVVGRIWRGTLHPDA
jgi:undecaprenyl-diphosphatase